jgi:hypothetical protein
MDKGAIDIHKLDARLASLGLTIPEKEKSLRIIFQLKMLL